MEDEYVDFFKNRRRCKNEIANHAEEYL